MNKPVFSNVIACICGQVAVVLVYVAVSLLMLSQQGRHSMLLHGLMLPLVAAALSWLTFRRRPTDVIVLSYVILILLLIGCGVCGFLWAGLSGL